MGERFQAVRLRRRMTQAKLAAASGLPLRSIQEWEQGTRIPRWDRVIRIADALGVSLDELAGRTWPEAEKKKGKDKK